jgi:pimeloyl-ACP methyl ester carboxylesterase
MKLAVKLEFPPPGSTWQQHHDLVMIHGTGANAEMWRPQVELLKQHGYRCFLPEFRGHGESEEPGHQTGIEVHIEDMLDSLLDIGIRFPAVFIGHSLGAIISLELAQRKPELFQQILAVAMPGRVIPAVSKAFRLLLNTPFEKLRGTAIHARLPWRERTLISTHRHSLEQIVENFTELNYVERQLVVECPVHFSVGRLDPVAPAHYVRKLHQAMPSSTLHVFEWAGHNCMDERPDEFNSWLLEKLEQEELLEFEDAFEPAPKTL